ncbi:MAG: fumarate hydratase [Oscillospiraceae bacterium]|nr:fumarate hydratase [Oscillospiraceae bacterium]
MREVSVKDITNEIARLCEEACCHLPRDVVASFEKGMTEEKSPVGRDIFKVMCDNAKYAAESGIPACQDTGMAVVFIDIGQEVHLIGGDFYEAVNEGVRRGYVDGKLRLSVVGDPIRRVNTNDNTPAILHTRIVSGDKVSITVAPKGFGSENMSAMKMFKPSATTDDIIDFIVETVSKAGSNPCPPVIVGVGLGGTVDMAALCAKRALLRDVGSSHEDELYASLEAQALEKVNKLGIGPQGLGGSVTALAVFIEKHATHIAGLPCVVNMGCHISRHASAII